MPDLEIDMHSNPFGDQDDPDRNFDKISVRSHSFASCCHAPVLQLTSEDQLQLTSQNVEFLEKRDKEIREVLRSIEDVNEIFRDVAALISNQVRLLRFEPYSQPAVSRRAPFSIKSSTTLRTRSCSSNKETSI